MASDRSGRACTEDPAAIAAAAEFAAADAVRFARSAISFSLYSLLCPADSISDRVEDARLLLLLEPPNEGEPLGTAEPGRGFPLRCGESVVDASAEE